MTRRLDGKVALILGGTSGMGLAAAKLFLAEGAKVIITGRTQETLEAARVELTGDYYMHRSDIGNYGETHAAIVNGVDRFGKIDVFYQVAGMAGVAPFAIADISHYEEIVTVDLLAPIAAAISARAFLNDGASMIFTTTTASTRALPGMTAYGAAKAGLAHFARSLALELAERDIRVNVISPGTIDTPIFDKLGLPEDQIAGIKQFFAMVTPNRRLGSPDDVARAALFLASDESAHVTGVTLDVDGGLNRSWHLQPTAQD